jgi:hypothetical protein
VPALLEAQELEAFVVFVIATCHRGKIIPASAGEARARRRAFTVRTPSSRAAAPPCRFTTAFGGRSPARFVAPASTAPTASAFTAFGSRRRLAGFRLPRGLAAAVA